MGWQASLRQINPAELDVPLTALRLPKKTEILEAQGLTTVRALVGGLQTGMVGRIPSVGSRTVRAIEERLSFLPEAVDPASGKISWQKYALACGFELVPASEVTSGAEFLGAFPEVIDAIIRFNDSPVDRLILTERLVRQPHQRRTLEEIARAAPETITRERVRQRQELLLRSLSNGLLFDDHRELPFHFRESFAGRWQAAAEQFTGETEISFGDFMAGLEQAWNVSSTELSPHLPLVTSVLTSRAQIPHQLRQGMKLHPRLHEPLSPGLAKSPLAWLATGKAFDEISGYGVDTVGDLIEAGRHGRLPGAHTSVGKCCAELLAAIGGALDENGDADWGLYGAALGFPLLPAEDRLTPDEFLRKLNEDLEKVIRVNATSLRAADVFRLRTSMPQAERRTLAQVAELLGSHGPSIKREETILLDALHTQLVLSDFAYSRVIFRSGFLRWWREAWTAYRASGSSYLNFCNGLALRWQLPQTTVCKGADGLWAVLARYPNRHRVTARSQRQRVALEEFAGGTIVLRGFRRAH